MPKGSPDLIFEKGPMSGFAILAEQASVHPATVVRELVQNSLDAAAEANRPQTVVRFELSKHKSKDIPAFDTYKAAFRKVLKTSSHNQQDSAQGVIQAIEAQVKSTRTEVLYVMDNGIGLNDERMMALLSEAINVKKNNAAGSYGYGHTTVIPASDLRYILYGGVCKEKRIAAGHAILASFMDKREIMGKDGYFVVKKNESMSRPFVYAEGAAIPDIIRAKLDVIESEWKTGSVIIIPGFNHFKETKGGSADDVLWQSIIKAVACNFFVAIHGGKLKIEYMVGKRFDELSGNSISGVLDHYSSEKRSKHFLSGHKAQQAYNVLLRGEVHEVRTSLGNVAIRSYQHNDLGRSEINLCRNGMHITNRVPHLTRTDFASYIPFHCLILVDGSDGEFHRLIRKAEPPKHDEIQLKMLDKKERKKLINSLKQIREYLKSILKELENEEFGITDVLNLKSYGVNAVEESPPRTRMSGRDAGRGLGSRRRETGGGRGASSGGSGFKKEGSTVPFRAIPVQTGGRSYVVQVNLEESKHDNEIRFALDESLDLTCDIADAEDFVHLVNVTVDSVDATKDNLIKNDKGKILGINLGSGETRQVTLAFDFVIPTETGIDKDTPVSLQAEIVRRKIEKED